MAKKNKNPKKMEKPELLKLYYETERNRKKAWRTFYATIEEEYQKYLEIQSLYFDLQEKYKQHQEKYKHREIPSFFIEDMKELMKKHKETFECPICLEDMNHKNMKVLISCGHRFHLKCIKIWYETSEKCPCCRKKFSLF